MPRPPLLLLMILVSQGAPLASQVTADRPLAFGIVVAGTATNVSPASANAAQWRMHGTYLLGGTFSLTLPATLLRQGGSETMPIAFCATCGIRQTNNSNPATGTVFNPTTTQTVAALSLVVTIYVWLGASVTPPSNQVPGTYTGTVVLTTTGLL
jgi:hypothetical protein